MDDNLMKENEVVSEPIEAQKLNGNETKTVEDESMSKSVHENDAGVISSEMFKIEVKNLPRQFGFAQLKKLFNQLNLKFLKLKAPGSSSFAFVTFANEEARVEACKILNGTKFKGRQLEAVYSAPSLDPLAAAAKRKLANMDENIEKASVKIRKEDDGSINNGDGLSLEERVQNSATPLWKLSYEKQLEKKLVNIKGLLKKYAWQIDKTNTVLFYWLKKQQENFSGQCCELTELVKSPVIENYRNKGEFTIGYDKSETNCVIGFRLGEYKAGSNEVVEPYCCKNISDLMRWFVKKFKEYVDQNEYKAFNVRTRTGNWSTLTIRSNLENEFIAIVIFNKQELNEEQISKEKRALGEYFKKLSESEEANSLGYKMKGLLFNLNTNKTGMSRNENLDLLFGQDFIYETLLNTKFRISPLAFFQANTKGAEVLYTKIGEFCEIDDQTVVLDICCGTGTIGLTLAQKAKLVVGVEIIPEAIEDAKFNSKLNNISNVEFHCGKAEEILPDLLKRFSKEKIIAIIDPPRAGLHSKVIQNLRRLENLKSLVYVSCDPEAAMQNFIDLSRETSKNYMLSPFVPVRSIAVDMFPLTTHCELVIYFKRYSSELIKSSSSSSS